MQDKLLTAAAAALAGGGAGSPLKRGAQQPSYPRVARGADENGGGGVAHGEFDPNAPAPPAQQQQQSPQPPPQPQYQLPSPRAAAYGTSPDNKLKWIERRASGPGAGKVSEIILSVTKPVNPWNKINELLKVRLKPTKFA